MVRPAIRPRDGPGRHSRRSAQQPLRVTPVIARAADGVEAGTEADEADAAEREGRRLCETSWLARAA